MPVKITWKSLVGFLAVIAGFVLPYVQSALPHYTGAAAVFGGLLVIGLERVADAKDFATTGGVDVGALSAALSDAKRELATVKAQAQSDLASARSSVIAEIARAAATPAPVPPAATAAPTPGVPQ